VLIKNGKWNLFNERCPLCRKHKLTHIRLENLLSDYNEVHITINQFSEKLNPKKEKRFSYLCCVCTSCKVPFVIELHDRYRNAMPNFIYDGYEIKNAMDEASKYADPF
jgi:hypothetical protein